MHQLSEPITFTAGETENGIRIDILLARQLPAISRARLQKIIVNGGVFLNGQTAKKNTLAKTGDIISAHIGATCVDEEKNPIAQKIDISVIYEDSYILAINKAAGMVVHPGSGVRDGTLVNALLFHLSGLPDVGSRERPGIIHRLDKETSGVLLVAKTEEAHHAFSRLFAQRTITKTYIGVCIGEHPPEHGLIDAAVGRSRRERIKQSVRADGRVAITEYQLAAYHSGMSLLKLHPLTGRTHQLRLHCRHAGFPIIGDATYGSDREYVMKLNPLERTFAYRVLKCFSRHALHARRIEFVHPFTTKKVTIEAPFPKDFLDAIALFNRSPSQF